MINTASTIINDDHLCVVFGAGPVSNTGAGGGLYERWRAV